jgi:anti-sigma factor RsiW
MRLWRRKNELTCQELVELVTDYFEGALSAGGRARFERHIATCPHCTTYLDQMRITIRTLGRLPEETVSPDAREALLGVFHEWKRERLPGT